MIPEREAPEHYFDVFHESEGDYLYQKDNDVSTFSEADNDERVLTYRCSSTTESGVMDILTCQYYPQMFNKTCGDTPYVIFCERASD